MSALDFVVTLLCATSIGISILAIAHGAPIAFPLG